MYTNDHFCKQLVGLMQAKNFSVSLKQVFVTVKQTKLHWKINLKLKCRLLDKKKKNQKETETPN